MLKCQHCPIKDSICFAQRAQHKGFCDRIDPTKEGYNEKYIELLRHLSLGEEYKKAEYVEIKEEGKETIREKIIQDDPEPVPEQQYPSWGKMAGNLIKSTAKFVASGFELADEETIERRKNICNNCDLFDEEQGRCRSCGCWISAKSRIKGDRCPLPENRWGMTDEELANNEHSKDRKKEDLSHFTNSLIIHQNKSDGICCE